MKSKIKMNEKTKKSICIVLFTLLILIFVILLFFASFSQKIREIREFIKTDTKVLYISSDNKYKYPNEILKKYEIDCLNINSLELSVFEKKKLERIIETELVDEVLIIYKNGKIIDTLIDCNKDKCINEFLQENQIIPDKIVNNVKDIIKNANNILNNEYSMIYIPYVEHDYIELQDEMLEKISKIYSIDYNRIDAYLLSENQKIKINALLDISLVEDQILILVKDSKMVGNIRGIHSRNTYIETLYDVNFISELEDKIQKINYDEFKETLKESKKNILLIGSDELKDSNTIYELLNSMIYNYDIEVKYFNIDNSDVVMQEKINNKLKNIGYEGAFSLPIVAIIESGNILDYAIGNSKEEYFLDIFIENGIIKGDVVNE